MKRLAVLFSLIICLVGTTPVLAEDPPPVVDLWPGGTAPGDNVNAIGPEKVRDALIVRGKPYLIAGRSVRWITNVTRPTLTIYRPAPEKNTGAAVLICPGGGYWNLGIDLEGEEVAQWLTSLGINGIILKFRVPRRPGQSETQPSLVALEDAQRAVSLVRSHAAEWGINPERIGMIGFSAGGHLVAATATNFDHRSYQSIDAVDEVSCRPDFGILCYPGLIKTKGKDELQPTVKAVKDSPPLFIVHATDDSEAMVDHSVILYLALKRAGAPVELHAYETGEHGFAVRKTDNPVTNWTELCADWLRFHGFLTNHSSSSPASP